MQDVHFSPNVSDRRLDPHGGAGGARNTRIRPSLIRSAGAMVVGLLSLSGCSEGSKLLDPRSDPSPVPSLSVAAAAVTVSVRDDYFTPDPINPGQGGTVQWSFDGFSTHTATDNSGMGLFDS